MFANCSSLRSVDLSKLDTSNADSLDYMFVGCESLTDIDVSTLDTSKVEGMSSMFKRCSNLEKLDLSNFKMDNVSYTERMFDGCSKLKSIKMPKNIKCDIEFPDGTWIDENGTVCTQATKQLPTSMTYTKTSENNPVNPNPEPTNPTPDKPGNGNTNDSSATNGTPPVGTLAASYEGNSFYQDANGKMRCYDEQGKPIINDFKCDGKYTYFFQADGTAMTDRLTYHPNGKDVIYFDESGHEVFNNFTHVKKSISGDTVDDLCFFDVYGHMYVDFITYDQAGTNLYYANPYGVMESNGWFQFSDGNIGYANADGTLMTSQFSYDPWGRLVYFQGDGKLARGLITDGENYYQMDENDGHCIGIFPVNTE
mgnify:CR=1 FL=1